MNVSVNKGRIELNKTEQRKLAEAYEIAQQINRLSEALRKTALQAAADGAATGIDRLLAALLREHEAQQKELVA